MLFVFYFRLEVILMIKNFGTLLEYHVSSNNYKRKPKSLRVGKTQNRIIMKKITFLVASIFLMGASVGNAAEKYKLSQERSVLANDFRNAEPVVFTEAGVEFYVFVDGRFDFNVRSSAANTFYTANRERNYDHYEAHKNKYYGVNVEQDRAGRVKRIGNVSVSYDRNNRVERVGSVQISYNRYSLERVGGLEIVYNRRGQIVDRVGSVKGGRGYGNNHNDHCDSDYNQKSNDYADYDNRSEPIRIIRQEPRASGNVAVRIVGRL